MRAPLSVLSPRTLLPATIVVVCLWPGTASGQLLGPGPLSSSHSHLEGADGCRRCHGEGRQVTASGCLSCHKALGARIRAGAGLHGRNYRGRNCGSCHREHRGRGAGIVSWPGGSRKALNHALTGWPLTGAHGKVQCTGCHKRRNSKGRTTYLGQRTNCGGCHEDFHKGRFGGRCENCHTTTAWNKVQLDHFDHTVTSFPLNGRHQQVPCAKCHGSPARYRGLEHSSCSSCHRKSPHSGADYANCESCHMDRGWQELSLVRRNHPGQKLVGGHKGVACTRCHDAGLAAVPSKGKRCVSCHPVVHEAKLGRNCERCHGGIRWHGLPRRVALKAHELTDFPLRGLHAKTKCNRCHRLELRRDDRWRNLDYSGCTSCHEDRHDGAFASRDGGECSQCHEVTGFYPSTFDVEQHATTAFPIVERHLAVPCSGCHGEERPRLSHKVADQRCEGCHENPHGDQFAKEMSDGGCAHCHTPRGWDTPQIKHDAWPRTGAHAKAKCRACHSPTEQDRLAGKGGSYRGIPRNCEGCHEDPHAGQFRLSEPVRDCDSCHSTTTFELDDVDHEALTGHPLKGRHLELECGRCHPEEELEGGVKSTRWRLGYRRCRSCHADPHRGGKR